MALIVSACGRDASQTDLLAEASPSGESPWLAAERQRFSDILSASPVNVVVVPFQTAGYGFDAAERSLLAVRVANYIAAHSELSVADPQLVGRALGEGWRRLDDTDIRALATAMQASHVVIGEIGHDRNSSFHIAIRIWSSNEPGAFDDDVTRAERSWELTFSDAEYPHQVFVDQLPSVAGMLPVGLTQTEQPASPPVPPAEVSELPELESLLEQPPMPSANRVDLLQLAALAYPWTPDRPVARGWIRTLKLAWRLPADEPDRTLLIARALAHLGRRPAALALMADARTPAERTLREWLNGNLPQGEREAGRIEDPVQRLIAHIELGDLRWTYGHTSSERERELLANFLSKESQWWPVLLSRLSSGSASWAPEYLLRLFPLSEPGWVAVRDRVEWLWELARTSADPTAFDVASAATALEYYNQWLAEHSSELSGGAHGTWLLLDLLAARVEGDVFEGLGATFGRPGRIDAAREDVAMVGRYFAGHPDHTAVKARLEWKEYDRRLGAERARWLAAALRDTEDAFYWAQELSRRLAPTGYHTPDIPEVSDRLRQYRSAYFWDLPGDVTWLPQGFRKNHRVRTHYRDTVIAYSVFQFQYFEWLMEQEQENAAWIQVVRDSLRNRFTGNPNVAKFHAAALRDSGDLAAAERAYRAVVARESAPYSAYDRLAEVLVEQGRFAEAFEVVDSYPGFAKDSGESAAYLANGAENSAMLFWRIGQFDYALPLLRRSSGYDAATSPSMTSNEILAQERGDYRAAARILMTQARRYRDFEALDEYLELAFALADYQPAWAVFEEVHRDGNGGQPLARIARSVRAQGWSDQKVREWLSGDRMRGLADGTYRYAAHAAVAAFIVGREPPDDLPELVRELQGVSPYFVDAEGNVAQRNPEDLTKLEDVICGPSDYGSGLALSPGEPVDSHLMYFARAYLALENGEYAEARHALEEAAGLFAYFAYSCENVSYLFPYLALTAALNDDTERLTRYLDTIEFKHRRTHYYLARAAIAGVAGKEDEALEALDKALYRWKSSRFRTVPTRYLYADICRRLYELTGSDAYRDRLLWWLDVHQRLNPAHSWAYAMQARLATDSAVRRRALALTLLLDRNSAIVKGAEESELQAARQWLVENNPFR